MKEIYAESEYFFMTAFSSSAPK